MNTGAVPAAWKPYRFHYILADYIDVAVLPPFFSPSGSKLYEGQNPREAESHQNLPASLFINGHAEGLPSFLYGDDKVVDQSRCCVVIVRYTTSLVGTTAGTRG